MSIFVFPFFLMFVECYSSNAHVFEVWHEIAQLFVAYFLARCEYSSIHSFLCAVYMIFCKIESFSFHSDKSLTSCYSYHFQHHCMLHNQPFRTATAFLCHNANLSFECHNATLSFELSFKMSSSYKHLITNWIFLWYIVINLKYDSHYFNLGSPVVDTWWGPGEPTSNATCISLFSFSDIYLLNGDDCAKSHRFVCQFSKTLIGFGLIYDSIFWFDLT